MGAENAHDAPGQAPGPAPGQAPAPAREAATPAAAGLAPVARGRLPFAGSAAGVLALQRSAGNAAVTRMLARSEDSGGGLPGGVAAAPSGPADWDRLIRERDISGIKAAEGYGGANATQRLALIEILVHQGWVGPNDELAIEQLWDAFGPTGIAAAYENQKGLWDECVEAGAELYDISAVRQWRTRFESDVKAVAHVYMRRNRKAVQDEGARLGLGGLDGGAAPATAPNAAAVRDVQQIARELQRADDALAALRRIPVGYDWATYDSAGGSTRSEREVANFDPAGPPMSPPTAEEASRFGNWQEVKRQWDAATQARSVLAARNPAVFALSESGAGEAGRLAAMSPDAAAARLREVLGSTLRKIIETEPKIDDGDLDWRDLVPIHTQLYNGMRSESGVAWSSSLAKNIASDVIGDYQARQFWVSLGLGSLAAAAFIFSEIATGGMATFLWAAAGVAASGAQAGMSIERYDDLVTAAGTATSPDSRLVGDEQVSEARVAAVLDTVFAFIDVLGAARGVASAARAVAAREAVGSLAQLSGPEAAQAIERAVRELGPQETIRRSGQTAEELAAKLAPESDAAASLRAAAGDRAVADPAAAGIAATAASPEGRRVAQEAQGLFTRWQSLAPPQRLAELLEVVNQRMRRIGAPDLRPGAAPAPGALGSLGFGTWSINVRPDLLSAATVTEAQFADLVGVIAHEARHGEQWFRMAQVEAMAGHSAPEIARKLGIPEEIATAAREVQSGARAGEKLAGGALEAQARAWHESVYGAVGGARRSAIYREMDAAVDEVKAADQRWEQVVDLPDGHPSKVAGEQRVQNAHARQRQAVATYKALAEEVDAYAVGGAVTAAVRERLDMISRIAAAKRAERAAYDVYKPLEDLYMSVVGKPNMHLTYDNMLAYDHAMTAWKRAFDAVAVLESQLARLAPAP